MLRRSAMNSNSLVNVCEVTGIRISHETDLLSKEEAVNSRVQRMSAHHEEG